MRPRCWQKCHKSNTHKEQVASEWLTTSIPSSSHNNHDREMSNPKQERTNTRNVQSTNGRIHNSSKKTWTVTSNNTWEAHHLQLHEKFVKRGGPNPEPSKPCSPQKGEQISLEISYSYSSFQGGHFVQPWLYQMFDHDKGPTSAVSLTISTNLFYFSPVDLCHLFELSCAIWQGVTQCWEESDTPGG